MRVVRISQDSGVDLRASSSFCELIARVQAVVIMSGHDTLEQRDLIRHCHQELTPALQVTSVDDLEPAWFADVDTAVLVTMAATSVVTADEVHRRLERMGRVPKGDLFHADALDSSGHARSSAAEHRP